MEEFKKRMEDPDFVKLFRNANTNEEIIEIARQQGYNIDEEMVEKFKLSEDMLEEIAGGSKDTYRAGKDLNIITTISYK